MARISQLSIKHDSYVMRNEVSQCKAELNAYEHFGEKMVRLQTFGSKSRKDEGKQSQVLHIDKNIAEQLVTELKKIFDL